MHTIVAKRIAPMALHSPSTSHGDDPLIKIIKYDVFEEKSAQELLFEVCEKYIFFSRISDSRSVRVPRSFGFRSLGTERTWDFVSVRF